VPGWPVVTWDISSGGVLGRIADATAFSSGMALSRDGRQMAAAAGESGVTGSVFLRAADYFTALRASKIRALSSP